MYTVSYRDSHDDPIIKIIHASNGHDNQALSGQIEQVLNGIDTFDFEIGISNPYYGQTQPIVGLIDVHNDRDGELEFRGRIIGQSNDMDNQNRFSQNIECTSLLSYLHDSSQGYRKVANNGARNFFETIIDHHNASVEPHKRFKIGRVTKDAGSDIPYRYIGYQTTFDTVKEHVLDKIGGVIILRHEPDGMYLDWLDESDVGDHIPSPIEWGENMVSANREIEFSEVISRLMPIGADLEQDIDDEEQANQDAYGSGVVRPRVMISSVHTSDHIDDPDLIEQFGILEKPINWADIDDPQTLKERAIQFMENQRAFLSSWTAETAELWMLDARFDKFKVGNWHPIINPPISGIEELQIVNKKIDILDVRQVDLDIGQDKKSLTSYQLQVQEATKSIENVRRESQIERQRNQALLNEINSLTLQLEGLLGDGGDNQGAIAELQARIAQLEAQLAEGGSEI